MGIGNPRTASESRRRLLLLTPEFLASRYCVEIEGAEALKQAASGKAAVYAVLLDPCDYQSQFGTLPLLSDRGNPLRSAKHPATALREIQLAIKFDAYRRFEEKNSAVTFNNASEHPECKLVDAHYEHGREMASRRGSILLLTGAAALGTIVAALYGRTIGFDHWWGLLLTLLVSGGISGAAAAIVRQIGLTREEGKEWSWAFTFEIAGIALIAGMGAGIMYGGPLTLLVAGVRIIPRAPAMPVICGIVAMILFANMYFGSRPKRLAVYRELVRARRRPRGGWRLRKALSELEKAGRRVEQLQEERLRQLYSRPEPPPPPAEPEPPLEPERPPEEIVKNAQDIHDYIEEARRWKKEQKKRDRQRWREEIPQGGRPCVLLALHHSADETAWRELEAMLRKEGIADLCHLRSSCIDRESDWKEALADAAIVLPMLSVAFIAVPACGDIAQALTAREETVVYPIQLETIDAAATPFGQWQFLPDERPVDKWAIRAIAWQNVARNLILPAWNQAYSEDGLPPLTTRGWDFDSTALELWISVQLKVAMLVALIVWGVGRHWTELAAGLAMAFPALGIALFMLFRERRKARNLENFDLERYAFEALALDTLPLFLTTALASSVFPLLFLLSVLVSPRSETLALITFLDIGLGGGLLFGVLGYLASRRKRPNVLLKQKPPEPDATWVGAGNGKLLLRFVRSGRRGTEGSIGGVSSARPVAAEASEDMGMKPAALVRFCIELAIATLLAWKLVLVLTGEKPSFGFPFAVLVAFFVEGILVWSYVNLIEYVRERREPYSLSLWRRLKWTLHEGITRPMTWPASGWFYVFMTLNVAAHIFSAPVAIPLMTTTAVVVFIALLPLSMLYVD